MKSVVVIRPLIFLSLITNVYATILCECGPLHYSFRLNFSGLCDDPALDTDLSKGYEGYLCGIAHVTCNESELPNCKRPVNITEFYMLEHKNHNFQIIVGGLAEEIYSEPLYDGDIVEYTSITMTTLATLVRRITVKLVGYNEYGHEISFLTSWKYTNECDLLPINPKIEPFRVGWIEATNDTVQAHPSTCQYPSSSPSQTPTLSRPPSKIPSENPSFIPTDLPTAFPSTEPSRSKIGPHIFFHYEYYI